MLLISAVLDRQIKIDAHPYDDDHRHTDINGRRFVQRVEGYEATLVAGAPIFERGEHTGALPGKLVRAGRMGEASAAA